MWMDRETLLFKLSRRGWVNPRIVLYRIAGNRSTYGVVGDREGQSTALSHKWTRRGIAFKKEKS